MKVKKSGEVSPGLQRCQTKLSLKNGLPISKPLRLNNKGLSRQLTLFELCFHRTRKTNK